MADPRLFRLRVTFREAGRLALLSHLELTRALERTVRRANLPFAVTQGFSPHMRIAFGAALPVGIGGEEEFFDLYLARYLSPDKALAALQASCVDDLAVLACGYVENSAPAASVAFPLSTYVAVLSADAGCLVVPEVVTVRRKKKEKTLRVADYLVGDVETCGREVRFTLEAKESGSLRPDVFLRAGLDATAAVRANGSAPADADCSEQRIVTFTRTSQRNARGESVRG